LESGKYKKNKLRKRAESRLTEAGEAVFEQDQQDSCELMQELRTHKVELEIMNEELRQTEQHLIEARNIFSDLYDFAPVGYLTISDKGTILQANLTLASMLGVDRSTLIRQRFTAFIEGEDVDGFYLLRKQTLTSKQSGFAEMRLKCSDASSFWARLDVRLQQSEEGTRLLLTISDISDSIQNVRRTLKEKERLAISLALSQMTDAKEQDVLDYLLKECIAFTGSEFSFIGFMSEDESVMQIYSWSKEVLTQCDVQEKFLDFSIAEAGLWAEPVRQRKAVIINDLAGAYPQKRSYPQGHVPIHSYLGVPVFEGDHLRLLVAVANKAEAYSQTDIHNLTSLMTEGWRIVSRMRSEAVRMKLLHDLNESVKETGVLYKVANLVRDSETIDDMLQQVAALVPDGMQFPQFVCCTVSHDEKRYHSSINSCREASDWRLTGEIIIHGKVRGSVEIRYLQACPLEHIGPFLNEEQKLIEAVADHLSRAIELRNISKLQYIQSRISTVFLTITDIGMYAHVLDIILESMDSSCGVFAYINETGDLVVPGMTGESRDNCQIPHKDIVFPRESWGDSSWPRAIREKAPNYSNQPSSLMPEGHISISKHLCMPVVFQDEVIGLFQIANREKDYGIQDVEIMEAIARHIAPILAASLESEREQRRRITAESEVREKNRDIKLLLNSTAEAIYAIDLQGNCTLVNKSCLQMLGYQKDELLGENMHEKIHHSYVDSSHYPEGQCKIEMAMRLGEGIHVDDEVYWRKDGSSIPVSYWSYPMYKNKEMVGSVVTFLDISEQLTSREALKRSAIQLECALEGTIAAIAKAVEARDPYTAGHQRQVSKLAVAIANEMGLDSKTVNGIRLGAEIHDIGKIQVPTEILSKPGKLTTFEYQLIQTHSESGYEILKDVEFEWPIADIAYQHHERINGSGYPQGLSGNDICLEARVVAVADVVEAMSSHRPYRAGLGIDIALEEIRTHSSILFDSKVVEACLKLFAENRFSFSNPAEVEGSVAEALWPHIVN